VISYLLDDIDLIQTWQEKYFDLLYLLYDILASGASPGVLEEMKYSELRNWLVQHEAAFLVIWGDFVESRNFSIFELLEDDPRERGNLSKVCSAISNPFRCFYHLESVTDIPVWDFSKRDGTGCKAAKTEPVELFRRTLASIAGLLDLFCYWFVKHY